jgi:hypothetical protein
MQAHQNNQRIMATAAEGPGLLAQLGMAGGAAVITVSFIHPIDVIKVGFECPWLWRILAKLDGWSECFSRFPIL